MAIILGICAFQAGRLISDGSGMISLQHGLRIDVAAHVFADHAGDTVLTAATLPLSWTTTGRAAAEQKLRIRGGYLLALRTLMILPLVAALAAARRRIRVRPADDSS